jgi:hypothetical protein
MLRQSPVKNRTNGSVLKGHEAWREYCENALALELLIRLQSRSKMHRSTHLHEGANHSSM